MKRYLPAAALAYAISFPFQALDAIAADTESERPMTYTERLCERVAQHVVESRLAGLDLKAMNNRQIERLKQLTFSSAVSTCHDDAKAVYREMKREREGA